MAGRYKDSKQFMTWYHNLDEDQKKQHNRKRYMQSKLYKERLERKKNKLAKLGNLLSKVSV